MELKQSIQNIQAWVKAHPWPAAAILGAVILLAWYMARKAGSGGSPAIGPGEADSAGSLDSFGAGSGGGYTDALSQLDASANPITPASPVTSVPSLTTSGMNQAIPDIPSLSDAFNLPASVISPVLVGAGGVLEQSGLTSGAVGSRSMVNDLHVRAPSVNGSTPGAGISNKVATNNPLKQRTEPAQTPSMRVGKGRHFTGTYLGITYVNGYPVTSGPIAGTSVLPGGRVASNQILNLMPSAKPAIKKGR